MNERRAPNFNVVCDIASQTQASLSSTYHMLPDFEILIREYCVQQGIHVPVGFARQTPQRYVIIRTHLTPPKLIARTWSEKSEVIHFIDRFLAPELGKKLSKSVRILDFKYMRKLIYVVKKRLDRGNAFCIDIPNFHLLGGSGLNGES